MDKETRNGIPHVPQAAADRAVGEIRATLAEARVGAYRAEYGS